MGLDEDLTMIIADLEELGVGTVVTATIYARAATTTGTGSTGYAPGDARGAAFKCLLDPVSDVREVVRDRRSRTITHAAFCPADTVVSPDDYLVTAAGDEFEVLRKRNYAGHHVELDLEEMS